MFPHTIYKGACRGEGRCSSDIRTMWILRKVLYNKVTDILWILDTYSSFFQFQARFSWHLGELHQSYADLAFSGSCSHRDQGTRITNPLDHSWYWSKSLNIAVKRPDQKLRGASDSYDRDADLWTSWLLDGQVLLLKRWSRERVTIRSEAQRVNHDHRLCLTLTKNLNTDEADQNMLIVVTNHFCVTGNVTYSVMVILWPLLYFFLASCCSSGESWLAAVISVTMMWRRDWHRRQEWQCKDEELEEEHRGSAFRGETTKTHTNTQLPSSVPGLLLSLWTSSYLFLLWAAEEGGGHCHSLLIHL